MARRNVKVSLHPVSDAYSGPDEKQIEFSTAAVGGIVTFVNNDDGSIDIHIASVDGVVRVNGEQITPAR